MRSEGLLSLSLSLIVFSWGFLVALRGEDLNKDPGDNDHIPIGSMYDIYIYNYANIKGVY